jgi:hypothetical protein
VAIVGAVEYPVRGNIEQAHFVEQALNRRRDGA